MADRVAPFGLSGLVTGQTGAPAGPDVPKIKRNIQRMIDQNAPESDIDAYVASEGVTPELLRGEVAAPDGNAERHGMAPEAADMFTMGLQPKINALGGAAIDKAVSLVTGDQTPFMENYDRRLAEQRADQEAYEEQNPGKSRVAQAGGLAGGVAALPEVAAVKGTGLLSRLTNASATGALYGGVGGAAQDANSLEDRAKNTAMGAGAGMILAPLAIPAAKVLGKVASAVSPGKAAEVIPTVRQIHGAKTQAYQAAKESGLVLKPETFNKTADKIVSDFIDDAVDADLQPKAAILMKRLEEAKNVPLTLTDLDNLRKKAVRIAQHGEKDEAHFAGKMIESIDEFLDNLKPSEVSSGDPVKAASQIDEARELARRARKSEMIETAFTRAENAVGANYTQAGMQTAIQQQFRRIADDPKKMRLYSADEQKMITAVVRGAKGQVLLNILRKFNPSNAFAIVGATMNPALGVPALIAGQAAKSGSARMTTAAAKAADETIRKGSPLSPPPRNRLGDMLQNPLAQLAARGAGEYGPKLRGR